MARGKKRGQRPAARGRGIRHVGEQRPAARGRPAYGKGEEAGAAPGCPRPWCPPRRWAAPGCPRRHPHGITLDAHVRTPVHIAISTDGPH
eukprot:6577932-Heterocapsa_arctica.AAC.1